MYAIKGYTVSTKAQAQSVLILAKLQGDARIVQQCLAVIAKLQA